MQIQKDILLAPYTTFNIGGPAKLFCVAENEDDLSEALKYAKNLNLPILILGGGSNILISESGFPGLVINFKNTGFKVVKDDNDHVWIRISSGEVWDEVVARAVQNGWWGVENLSHIPGLTGGFVVQNVGAYGQEASQVVETVESVFIDETIILGREREFQVVKNVDCHFQYRSSIFNREQKGKHVIIYTTIKLKKNGTPNLSYGDLKKYFTEQNITTPTQQQVRQAVIEIRNKKFPFPDKPEKGSAGSFFNALPISLQEYQKMVVRVGENFGDEAKQKLSDMLNVLSVPQGVKVPFGFLIEICGLKGHQIGGAKVCETHAGVLMNASGKATAKDVLELFRYVRQTVYKKTGITLKNEPELVGFNKAELDYAFEF